MFITRKTYDNLVQFRSEWMEENWPRLRRQWNENGVLVEGNQEVLNMLRVLIRYN